MNKHYQYGCPQNSNGVFKTVDKKSQSMIHFPLFLSHTLRHI